LERNDLFQKNLKTSKTLTEVYDKLDKTLYDVEVTKDNNYTIKVNNIYFHSKYAPIKEAERIIDLLFNDNEDLDVIILFGNGLGYVLKTLYQKLIKNSNHSIKPYIIYIEKDLKILFTTLSCFDFTEELKNENVKFFLDAEKELIGSFIQSIPTKKVRYYYHRPSFSLNEEYYKDVQNYINYILDRKDMNTATFKRFQKLWTKNFINNLPFFINSNCVNNLKNIGKNTTSIVVAGGPNLEKSIQFLKEKSEGCVVIAVDTVYKYLKKQQIKVDIIVTVDPQYWNYKYLENIKLTDEIIVTDSSTYYKIFQLIEPERIFVPNSIFQVAKYFENYDRGVLSAGGSVATTAFDIARIIGSSDIILIGLDLSFPDRKTHFKGAFFETNFLTFSTYFNTAEDNSYRYLAHVDLIKTKSTNGEVFTDGKMLLFKKWFDREVPLTNAKVYSPNMGGVLIDGTILTEIEKIVINSDKTNFLNNLKNLLKEKKDTDFFSISEKINNFLNKTKEIKTGCEKIVKLIRDDGVVKSEDIKTIENEERNIFMDINKNEIAKIISSSAQDIIISIMENYNYDKDEIKSSWIKTKILYNSIIELADFYSKKFTKILKIMKNNPNLINVRMA